MNALGLFGQYATNVWNGVDWAALTCSMLLALLGGCGGSSVRGSGGFRVLGALGSSFLWVKLMGSIKIFNVKLATFVYSLNIIIRDLADFTLILVMVMLMFACMFHLLIFKTAQHQQHQYDHLYHQDDLEVDDDSLLLDDAVHSSFDTVLHSTLTIVEMVLSEFSRNSFASESYESSTQALAILLFIAFMFFVVVVMLNVLIAVVSDAYDYSMTRAQQLFLRTRLQLVAELDSLGLTDHTQSLLSPALNTLLSKSALTGLFRKALRLKTEGNVYSDEAWVGRVLHMERTTAQGVEHVLSQLAHDREQHRRQTQQLEKSLSRKVRAVREDIAKHTGRLVADAFAKEAQRQKQDRRPGGGVDRQERRALADSEQRIVAAVTAALKAHT
eukprot:CAMPEP_0171793340 /NCGR_PEP_ID=MMETSP0991-20121206/67499_1 /TAXON_ID=483369 /ORGANISM="non described non described, Strain CCMP2098" /LENGTH=385 /DNA_ID=CAMNT_0012403587 /DNA_START=21 /DNA_END=1178 /DNA_ORIENTATION=+